MGNGESPRLEQTRGPRNLQPSRGGRPAQVFDWLLLAWATDSTLDVGNSPAAAVV